MKTNFFCNGLGLERPRTETGSSIRTADGDENVFAAQAGDFARQVSTIEIIETSDVIQQKKHTFNIEFD